MFILDFLMLNNDRHLNNFGIIRDANNLKWLDVAPIFDNDQSLNIEYYDDKEMQNACEGRFFYEFLSFEEIVKVVKDIKRIDVNKLDGVAEWFDDLLHKYQNITNYSDSRINKLCILLNRQINKLSKTGHLNIICKFFDEKAQENIVFKNNYAFLFVKKLIKIFIYLYDIN